MIESVLPPVPTILAFVKKLLVSAEIKPALHPCRLHLIQLSEKMWLENVKAYMDCLTSDFCTRYEVDGDYLECPVSDLLLKCELKDFNVGVILTTVPGTVVPCTIYTNLTSLDVSDGNETSDDLFDVEINFTALGKYEPSL